MFCSTIIPTVGRPTLSRSVESVLSQEGPANEFEVIVVNDSGHSLPIHDWQRSENVRILNTNCRERSVARNTGAAIAVGTYLHFLDDDDWLCPKALDYLHSLAVESQAAWIYGSSLLVDRQGKSLIQLKHELYGNAFIQAIAGEWIPLQASLIKAQAFFDVGGFDPRISGPEDIDLLRRIALHHDLAGIHLPVANIEMGISGSTTNYEDHAERSRWSREKLLDATDAFPRMRKSAKSSYWCGRIVRAYLTSSVWNLQHGRPLAAASRALMGLASLASSGKHVFSRRYWTAVATSYQSFTFSRGLQEAGGNDEPRTNAYGCDLQCR